MTMRRYEPRSPLQAIDPQAIFMLFAESPPPVNEGGDQATIVTVRGPLSQYDDWWSDSYEAIRARVEDACQQAAPVVVLRIDSPGGDVAGLFDTARAIRGACDRSGKRLLVHVEGQCCSAAYALATAADRIVSSRTAQVGSIGVIAARLDESRAMETAGVKVSLIASGARKTDGYPCTPMSDEERATFQADIDDLAAEFFNLVAARRHRTTQEIAALEAASYRGEAALNAGLVDELGSYDHMIASLGAAPTAEEKKSMDQIKEALRAIAEDEECSDEERARARRALAALDEEEPAAESDEDNGDEPAEPEKKDDEEPKGAAATGTVSASTAGALAAHGADDERRLAALERSTEAKERKALLEAHGGVPKGLAKLLASKPLAEVRAVLAELPKPRAPKLGDAAATATVAGTRGANQDQASQLPPKESRDMRRAMGLDKQQFGIVQRGNALLLGAPEGEEVL